MNSRALRIPTGVAGLVLALAAAPSWAGREPPPRGDERSPSVQEPVGGGPAGGGPGRELPPPFPPGEEQDVLIRRGGPDDPFRRSQRLEPARREKAAFLGVSPSHAPPVLRRQMKLPQGVGLVVDFVEPGSPAEGAGVKEFDVLHKLNDQILVNPEQLAALVRTFKPGDEVKLTVLREGQPQTLSCKLVEKELAPLEEGGGAGGWGRLLGPGVQPGGFRLRPPGDGEPRQPGAGGGAREGMREELGRAVREAMRVPGGAPRGPVSVVWDDGTHALHLTGSAGRWSLVAKDAKGQTVFEGPVDTREEREKVPPEIRSKLERIQVQGLPGGDPPDRGPGPDDRPEGGHPDDRRLDGAEPSRPPPPAGGESPEAR